MRFTNARRVPWMLAVASICVNVFLIANVVQMASLPRMSVVVHCAGDEGNATTLQRRADDTAGAAAAAAAPRAASMLSRNHLLTLLSREIEQLDTAAASSRGNLSGAI